MEVHRWTLGRMQNPVRGLLHGTAAVGSVAALVWIVASSPEGLTRRAALAVFGLTLVVLYTVSTLYHSFPWREAWKMRMQRADHSAIYLFIAGSYTPLAVILFDGWQQWTILAMAWGIAAVGIGQLAFFPRQTVAFSITLNTTLGWLAVLLLGPIIHRLGWTAVALLTFGGFCYTLGMVFLVTKRPRLWPRVFSYHEAFHVLVLAGSIAHYLVAWRWVARFAA